MNAVSLVKNSKRELSVFAAYCAMLLVLIFAAPRFFDHQFADTWISISPTLVLAIGMTLVILAREIDISIGSIFSICAIVAGLLAKGGFSLPMVVLGAICVGAALGAINGFLIAFLRLPSIVVTLATMVIFREALRWMREGASIDNLPSTFQWFGQSQSAGQWILVGIAFALFILFALGMYLLPAGRAVYAVGANQEAARLAGIRPQRVIFSVFVLMGALTGLAAFLQSIRLASIDPGIGTGLELTAIAVVVVGGTSISGGRGTLVGSLIGVALLGTVTSALVFLLPEAQWDKAIQGLIILIAVASDALYQRRS